MTPHVSLSTTSPSDAPVRRSASSCDDPPAHEYFRRFAHRTSFLVGTPSAFLTALAVVFVWAITGPIFHYSDTWQLVINTGTTIVTFLMVFLIQTTQNRDASAVHLKLDELIRATKHARNHLVALEQLSDQELAELELEFKKVHDAAAARGLSVAPPPPSSDQPVVVRRHGTPRPG
jgi:low affinity Fe/Cu permease